MKNVIIFTFLLIKISSLNAQVLGYLKNDVGFGDKVVSCNINYVGQNNNPKVIAITGFYICGNKAAYSFSSNGDEFFADTSSVFILQKDSFLNVYGYMDSSKKREFRDTSLWYAHNIIEAANIAEQSKMGLDALDYLTSFKKYGIAIWSTSLVDESEYTEGTGVSFRLFNPTEKVIKYVWITIVGINPVGDIVIDPIKRQSSIKLSCVGPIKSHEFAQYSFDYVWHTDLVEEMKINVLTVQFMDGRIKTIANGSAVKVNKERVKILGIEY